MTQDIKDILLDAALAHVPFDGWGEATFQAAAADVSLSVAAARAMFPRGAADLAAAYHRRGDDQMLARMMSEDISALRYSEKVSAAVRFRLEAVTDKEILRRGMSFYALPQHAAEGAALIWGTADKIWTALGDTSDDLNWYSKRAILSGVYGSTVLFWLGDTSEGHAATWAFLDRRIDDVMRFEKFKSAVRENAALKPLVSIANSVFGGIRAPRRGRTDLPGHWGPSEGPR
ncbi:MAG: COQ9 family protein [Paracoccaceae bacterium]